MTVETMHDSPNLKCAEMNKGIRFAALTLIQVFAVSNAPSHALPIMKSSVSNKFG